MAQKVKDDKTIEKLKIAERLRKILMNLPEVCYDFILSVENNTSILTRLNYAGDLRVFFEYLTGEAGLFDKPIRDLTSDDIKRIQPRHIDMYLDYLTIYERGERVLENHNSGKKRKLCAIRTFFKYCLKRQLLDDVPTLVVETPQIKEKPIVRLQNDEVMNLIETVENGKALTKRQIQFQRATKTRDIALVSLMLGTGIRVSECVGLNLNDVNFEHRSFKVTRKGGKQAVLYFSEDVERALADYLIERKRVAPLPGHEQALFLSIQRRRITVRAVQNLVEKYTKTAVPLKNITPHKLRSTFGTALYRATGDIYLVADVLGHRDVNTTRRHYADMSEENRKRAAEAVHYERKDE